MLELEVWERFLSACADCGGQRVCLNGEARPDASTRVVFWAFLYDHPGNPEVFVDAVFGSWDEGNDGSDHATFGSRTGWVEEPPQVACSLVTGGALAPDDPLFGRKLTRDEALADPRLPTFWDVNDAILGIEEVDRLLGTLSRRRRWPWSR